MDPELTLKKHITVTYNNLKRTKFYTPFSLRQVPWSAAKGDKVSCEDIFAVKDLQSPLLGRPAIESLSLVMRVEPINTTDHPMTKDVAVQ